MTNAQPEPSMEEILASIRRIISEDEEEGGAASVQTAPQAAVPQPEPAPEPAHADPVEAVPTAVIDVEEADEPLSEIVDEPAAEISGDEAHPHLETEDVEMIKNNVAEAMTEDASIIGDASASAASSAFQSLSQSLRVSSGEGRTLEDIVTELLKPMIKEWLDANLPAIVEEKVEDEVQRLARRRG
ncbi:MAG: DUF2497 domain-containing protein [Pseudomonadota bacterium]